MMTRSGSGVGLQGLIDNLSGLDKKEVAIGVPSSGNKIHKDSKINMATLAAIHELGAKHIPARPFLKKTIQDNAQKYIGLMAEGVKNSIARGEDPNIVYEKIGLIASADVKQYIVSGNFTPLAQSTIDRKGSSKPLIDIGELRNSISFEVRKA